MKIKLNEILKVLSLGILLSFLMSACSLPKQNTVADNATGTRTLIKSGTIHISGKSYALLLSGAWSKGMVHFQGKKYRIKAKSFGLGYSIGVKHIDIRGTVYNLKKITDINGRYTGVKAGATLGRGVEAGNMTNSSDVVLGLFTKSKGAAIDIGAGLSSLRIQLLSTKPVE